VLCAAGMLLRFELDLVNSLLQPQHMLSGNKEATPAEVVTGQLGSLTQHSATNTATSCALNFEGIPQHSTAWSTKSSSTHHPSPGWSTLHRK
jgi:hypothetical protein